ncbi:MAG: ATP-binding protein [Deltaproteobacteria bacterium]|nr:ATP-binding protein [Deltaproteobacteria bacterium]
MGKSPTHNNPFVYGKVVGNGDFFNRVKEKQKLLKLLQDRNNVLITGDRRIGKTSLLMNCFKEIATKNIDAFYFNLDPITSIKSFIERYGDVFTQKTSVSRRAIDFLKSGLKGFGLDIQLSDDGSPTASINWKGPGTVSQRTIPEILNLPQHLAESHKRRFLICFDEFQIARDLDGMNLISEMRAAFQHHDRITYVFMGSEMGILNQLFSSPKEKFFNSAVKFHLGSIARNEFIHFIQKKFATRKITIKEDTCTFICEWGGDIPANIQHLASAVWNFLPESADIVSMDAVKNIIVMEIDSNDELYLQMWQAIGDAKDQALLQRLARAKEFAVSSPKFCEPLSMNPATATRRFNKIAFKTRGSIIHLRSSGYSFSDPFFEEWIRRKT